MKAGKVHTWPGDQGRPGGRDLYGWYRRDSQASLAMSGDLGYCGVPHLLLEWHQVAERWCSERWDFLVANGLAWHD